MPTVYQFLENPQLFVYESTLSDNPEILNALIDYISKNPDPLIHNDQECYVYPNRSADILAIGTSYRAVIAKRQRKNKTTSEQQNYYPYLDRLFKNIQAHPNLQESLMGYTNKVLISFAKKTPEIYEYLKDNQQVISFVAKNNKYLHNFQQFINTLLIQSTMGLYTFLKNVVIRSLMFRIIDEKDNDNLIVYETLLGIYTEISKKLKSKILPEDEKQQLEQICVNFHDGDFITLLLLKISSKASNRAFIIGKMLNEMISNPSSKVSSIIVTSHMQTIQQYFESYEQSSGFLDNIMGDQLQILKLLFNLSQVCLLQAEHEANLMKRLLVYSSIHKKNSILHNILFKLIQSVIEGDRIQVFNQINVIPFLMKNCETKGCIYAYGSLIWKICQFWSRHESKLVKFLEQDERQFVKSQVQAKNKKLINLNFYKQSITNMSEIMSQKSQSHEENNNQNWQQVPLNSQNQNKTTEISNQT